MFKAYVQEESAGDYSSNPKRNQSNYNGFTLDVFSTGMIFFELATLKIPFERKDLQSITDRTEAKLKMLRDEDLTTYLRQFLKWNPKERASFKVCICV